MCVSSPVAHVPARTRRLSAPGPRRPRFAAKIARGLPLLLALLTACDRSSPTSQPVPAESAHERLAQLVFANRDGDRERVVRLTLPARRDVLSQTLAALDDFAAADERLVAYLRERFGAQFSRLADLSHLSSHRGVLSDDVALFDERPVPDEPDALEIAYMVADTPPARYARMVLRDGRWWYDPGSGFDPAIPQAFAAMTAGLDALLADLEADPEYGAALHLSAERFAAELARRLEPGLKLIPKAANRDDNDDPRGAPRRVRPADAPD